MTLFYREKSRYHVGRSGFTLIELIVVTVIIGILASVTAKLVGAKKHAYLAEMKSDLRNLASAEEAFHSDNFTYTGTIGVGMGMGMGMGVGMAGLDFDTSPGVVLELFGDGAGFSGRTTHASIPDRCALFLGSPATIYAPATAEGLMVCDGGGVGMGMGMGMVP